MSLLVDLLVTFTNGSTYRAEQVSTTKQDGAVMVMYADGVTALIPYNNVLFFEEEIV